MATIDIVTRPIEQVRSVREPTSGNVLTDNGNGTYFLVVENQGLLVKQLDSLIWLRDAIQSLLSAP